MMKKSESHYSPQVALMFIGFPQWGQTITPHFGCSNSSDSDTPKAEEIFSSVDNVGDWSQVIILLKEVAEIPTLCAKSFCDIPFNWQISLIRKSMFTYSLYSILICNSFPQYGQVNGFLVTTCDGNSLKTSSGEENNCQSGTFKASAILSAVSTNNFPFICLLNDWRETSSFSASSLTELFCSFSISLIRIIFF